MSQSKLLHTILQKEELFLDFNNGPWYSWCVRAVLKIAKCRKFDSYQGPPNYPIISYNHNACNKF